MGRVNFFIGFYFDCKKKVYRPIVLLKRWSTDHKTLYVKSQSEKYWTTMLNSNEIIREKI